MAGDVMNVIVIILVGVIIADMIAPSHLQGTVCLFKNVSSIWATSVNAMLGKPTG